MSRSYQRGGVSQNAFSTNLKIFCKSENFPQPWWNFYRIMEGFILRLIVKRLGGFKVVSCYTKYWYIIWKEVGSWIWKMPFAHNVSRAGDFMQSLFFLNIFSSGLQFFSGNIPKYWSLRILEKVQFKRCLLVCWWRCSKLVWIGSIKWIAWQRGSTGKTGSKKKLCMVPCHSYEI